MLRYQVEKPFVDFGMYHGVGDIISDVSMINSLETKLWDGTLTVIKDDAIPKKRKESKKEQEPKREPEPEAVKVDEPVLPVEEVPVPVIEESVEEKPQPTKKTAKEPSK